MANKIETQFVDSSRLKQVNLELGRLASQHRACRLNSGIFSGVGAVILALSLLGLIHILPAGADDWTQNPDSPVYAIAAQEVSSLPIKTALVAMGFATGLAFVFTARRKCSQQRSLWQREGELRTEMRQLRDELYIVDQLHAANEPHPKRDLEHPKPLDPDEARGEYVGVYNPPQSHRSPKPENA